MTCKCFFFNHGDRFRPLFLGLWDPFQIADFHGLEIGGDSFGGYLDHVPCFQSRISSSNHYSIFQGTWLPLRRGRCRKTHMYIPFSK